MKTQELPVSGAFHTPLMQPAREALISVTPPTLRRAYGPSVAKARHCVCRHGTSCMLFMLFPQAQRSLLKAVQSHSLQLTTHMGCICSSAALVVLPQVLASVTVHEPRMPVYSNVTGAPFASAAVITAMLARQLVEPVRWEATITGLIKGAGKEQLFELGPGAQIKAMVKRIDMGVWKTMRNVSV